MSSYHVIKIEVRNDDEYHYEVSVSDDSINLFYCESNSNDVLRISFSSNEEMESVAHAMLNTAKAARELGL